MLGTYKWAQDNVDYEEKDKATILSCIYFVVGPAHPSCICLGSCEAYAGVSMSGTQAQQPWHIVANDGHLKARDKTIILNQLYCPPCSVGYLPRFVVQTMWAYKLELAALRWSGWPKLREKKKCKLKLHAMCICVLPSWTPVVTMIIMLPPCVLCVIMHGTHTCEGWGYAWVADMNVYWLCKTNSCQMHWRLLHLRGVYPPKLELVVLKSVRQIHARCIGDWYIWEGLIP